MLLRRIGGGPLQTGTENGGGGALDGDDVDNDYNGSRGGGLSSINNKDGQVGGVRRFNDNGMRQSCHHRCLHLSDNVIWMGEGGGGFSCSIQSKFIPK
jgi:hypothetical protein